MGRTTLRLHKITWKPSVSVADKQRADFELYMRDAAILVLRSPPADIWIVAWPEGHA